MRFNWRKFYLLLWPFPLWVWWARWSLLLPTKHRRAVIQGLREIREGKTKPWRQVAEELGLS